MNVNRIVSPVHLAIIFMNVNNVLKDSYYHNHLKNVLIIQFLSNNKQKYILKKKNFKINH